MKKNKKKETLLLSDCFIEKARESTIKNELDIVCSEIESDGIFTFVVSFDYGSDCFVLKGANGSQNHFLHRIDFIRFMKNNHFSLIDSILHSDTGTVFYKFKNVARKSIV